MRMELWRIPAKGCRRCKRESANLSGKRTEPLFIDRLSWEKGRLPARTFGEQLFCGAALLFAEKLEAAVSFPRRGRPKQPIKGEREDHDELELPGQHSEHPSAGGRPQRRGAQHLPGPFPDHAGSSGPLFSRDYGGDQEGAAPAHADQE